ncbi:MAG: ABC transporter substrate-binding protein [Candidatus Hydrogenedentota bacterium]
MRDFYKIVLCSILVAGFILSCGRKESEYTADGRLILDYWEKWTGFEAEAMEKVVEEFNRSQDRLFVKYVVTAGIDRKLLVATAGGDPPDIAGIWTWAINIYADKGAITRLDDYAKKAGITRNDYIHVFYDMCTHRGKLWALPTTPATIALHWNKRLFREAGLDPNKAPKTIQELDEYAEKMTLYKLPDGKIISYPELIKLPDYKSIISNAEIIQMGFLPFEPGWWNWAWNHYFWGTMWNGRDKMTINTPEQIKAYKWIASYSEKFGKDLVERFTSSFAGQFASSQNAFLCGRVAMEIQGVWMYNFIDKYAPGMDWGCAPFPTDAEVKGLENVTVVEGDVLVIPLGARHPEESFEFIKFVQNQKYMEMLCMGHRKFTPLASVSEDFYKNHPHPYLNVFRELAKSKYAFTVPAIGISNEILREYNVACDLVRKLELSPEKALNDLQVQLQNSLDREIQRLKRRGKWQ